MSFWKTGSANQSARCQQRILDSEEWRAHMMSTWQVYDIENWSRTNLHIDQLRCEQRRAA